MAKKRKSILVPALLTAGAIFLLTRKKNPPKTAPGYTQTTTATSIQPEKTELVTKAIAGQL